MSLVELRCKRVSLYVFCILEHSGYSLGTTLKAECVTLPGQSHLQWLVLLCASHLNDLGDPEDFKRYGPFEFMNSSYRYE